MFQAIDLSSNFYFSYGYDLTHTLQYNFVDPKYITSRNRKLYTSNSLNCFALTSQTLAKTHFLLLGSSTKKIESIFRDDQVHSIF